VLRAAHHARPTGDLVLDLCRAIQGVFPCEAVELWLVERARIARWIMEATPERFYRGQDVEPDLFCELVEALGSSSTELAPSAEPPASTLALLRSARSGLYGSVLCQPLAVGDDMGGVLMLCSGSTDAFAKANKQLVQDLTQAVTAALAHNRVHLAQRERVKELSCLYELAQLATLDSLDLGSLLQRVVSLLPPSWQYPEVAAARIELDGQVYETQPGEPGWQAQRADIVVAGSQRGLVQVAYTDAMPLADEGPFLEEERRLIDTVAKEVSTLIERKSAQQERLRLLEQLQHADRLATIGHLAAGVAHELNEPLGAILGFAQLARKHPDLVEAVDSDIRKIEAAALHAREVTARLMHVGRRNTPTREPLDLNAVIRDALAFLGARMARSRIALACALEPELPMVTGNRAQLQQVVINLVVNAIQAMPDGGELAVETAAGDGSIVLVVRDSGAGMSEVIQARIFEPFFTTKQASEGTGLGLPVVREIVESLGGSIGVRSEPGAGASFRVSLPVDPGSARLAPGRSR
jgi:two-component system NtrC family sensor kinase